MRKVETKLPAWIILTIIITTGCQIVQPPFREKQRKIQTVLVWNAQAMTHDLVGHPESANRIKVVIAELNKQNLWAAVEKTKAREATDGELQLVHTKEYVANVKNWSTRQGSKYLTNKKWSPYNSPDSYKSASAAVGGLIDLSEAVAVGKYKNGFALIRPPGHHAIKGEGQGFCIFNNIAVAAENLINKKLAKKILIVDIDAHHGNGIEEIFQNRADVYYISFHQRYIFPYSGKNNFTNTENIELNFLESEAQYKKKFTKTLESALNNVRPDYIIVSAGYDTHWRDNMSNLGLSLLGQAWLSEKLVEYAQRYSDGKIVFSLEGGYDLEVLSHGVANTLKALTDRKDYVDPIGPAPAN